MSQLEAMMQKAIAEDQAAEPEPEAEATEAPSEGEAPTEEASAEGTEAKADGEEKPAEEKTEEKPAEKEDPKFAARFAALSRKQRLVLETEAKVRAQEQAITHREREIEERVAQRAKELEAREAKLREVEARAERLLDDPGEFFGFLESKFGLKTVDDFQKIAKGAWSKPKPPPEPTPVKDEDKPLTRAELEKLWAQREAEARQKAEAESRSKEVRQQFTKLSGDPEKYEAAALLYSDEERYRIGDEIASKLSAQGKAWTLEDIADAVDEHARLQPRYQLLAKRMGNSATAKPSAPTAPSNSTTPAKQAATRTIPSEAAAERATVNGAGKRKSHQERMADMMRRFGPSD